MFKIFLAMGVNGVGTVVQEFSAGRYSDRHSHLQGIMIST